MSDWTAPKAKSDLVTICAEVKVENTLVSLQLIDHEAEQPTFPASALSQGASKASCDEAGIQAAGATNVFIQNVLPPHEEHPSKRAFGACWKIYGV